jgi:hypothetical protein
MSKQDDSSMSKLDYLGTAFMACLVALAGLLHSDRALLALLLGVTVLTGTLVAREKWGWAKAAFAFIVLALLAVGIAGFSDEFTAGKRPRLTLSITSLVVSDTVPEDTARLQLYVTAQNLGVPTILHSWNLKLIEPGRVVATQPVLGEAPAAGSTILPPLDRLTGTNPFQGETDGLLYFLVSGQSKSAVARTLAADTLVLSVVDDNERTWRTQLVAASLGRTYR